MTALILTGPTCSGKGGVAYELAHHVRGEIISLDSMKVYRHMDIGTAKPPAHRRRNLPYHLIDVVDPNEEYNLGRYVREALSCAAEIFARGRTPVFVGGTPLYLWGLVRGFCPVPPCDPAVRRALERRADREGSFSLHKELRCVDPRAAQRIHPNDRRRIIRALEVYHQTGEAFSAFWQRSALRLPPGSYAMFGVRWPREVLYERINTRVVDMVGAGLLEEALRISRRFHPLSNTARQCIGYREVWEGLARGERQEEIVRAVQRNTRRFARKQGTWFRHFPEIRWLDACEKSPGELAAVIAREVRYGPRALARGIPQAGP